MENEILKIGDVVTLKSGGVRMTVDDNEPNGHDESPNEDYVTCIWMSSSGELLSERLNIKVLIKVLDN